VGDVVVSIDCGTTAIKAAAFGLDGQRLALASTLCPPISTDDARVEYDPSQLTDQAFDCLNTVVSQPAIEASDVLAVSVTNQRASVVCAKDDGQAVGNVIGWQDDRAGGEIDALRRRFDDDLYYQITGLPNHPVFSLGKMLWIQANDAARYQAADRIALLHDFLLRQLGCDDFFCDLSNASLTGLLDVEALEWSEDVLDVAGLDAGKLPTLVQSGQVIGAISADAAARSGLLEGTPLVAGGGDQQCAGVGAGAIAAGLLEVTLGTAAVPLCCADRPAWDAKRRVTCCVHAIPGKWVIEGLQSSAGSCLTWLWQTLGGEYDAFASDVLGQVSNVAPGSDGLLFFPYLSGAAAPHWDAEAGGAFFGLTLSHDRLHLARAMMEGVSLETREILDIFAALGVPIRDIRLTGGYTSLDAWNQVQADVFNRRVQTLREPEATLLGAAILAACGAGAFASVDDAVGKMVRIDRTFEPAPANVEAYDHIYQRYQDASARGWATGAFRRPNELRRSEH
jgi:xylulokinase